MFPATVPVLKCSRDPSAAVGMTERRRAARLRRRPLQGKGEGRGEESAERFLSARADPFTGLKGEEKVGLLRSK